MDLQVIPGCQLSSMSTDYTVVDLIKKGSFANVAKCVKSATNEMVAVQITRINSVFESEKKDDSTLRKLRAFDPDVWKFVSWDSSFIYKGHLCQEFKLLDMSLKDYIDKRPKPSFKLPEVRHILFQVASTLELLKGLEIVHASLSPENIMLVDHVNQPLKVKVINIGSAWDFSKSEQTPYIQPEFYRSPEAILGLPCNEAIDMWALGCIAAELFLGHALYPGCCDHETLWLITKTQGQLPGYLFDTGCKTSHFYRKTWPNIWTMKTPHEYAGIPQIDCRFTSLDDLQNIQPNPYSYLSKAAEKADLVNFVELVKEMLLLNPANRITPSQVLNHPFITMSHLVEFCRTQSPTSVPGDTESDKSSSTSSSETQQLHVSEDSDSCLVPIKPMKRNKRAYDEVLQVPRTPKEEFSFVIQASKEDPNMVGPMTESPRDSPTNRIQASMENLSCDYGEAESDKSSSTSSSETQQLQVSEDSDSCLVPIKPMKRNKRAYDEVLQESNKDQESMLPERKRIKICEQRSQVKRPYSEVYQGTKIDELSSPARKRRRLNTESEENNINLPRFPKDFSFVTHTPEEGSTSLSEGLRESLFTGIESLRDDPSTKNQAPKEGPALQPESEKRKLIAAGWQSDLTAPEEKPCGVSELPKIWIIGSTNVHKGRKASHGIFGDNFGLPAKVEWFGKGGMGWNGVLPRFYAEISNQSAPNILVIHAGGNDLGKKPAKKLADKMTEDLIKLHEEFPSMTIALSCINECQVWRNGKPQQMNNDRRTVHQAMGKVVCGLGGVVIEHSLIRASEDRFFLEDGVHFSQEGIEIFLTSIYNTLRKILHEPLMAVQC